jgi:uncharacterized protein
MHSIVANRRIEISALCRRHGVQRLEVFGSAARGIDFRPEESDVDFLVTYQHRKKRDALQQFFGLRDALSELLRCPVDLIEPGAVVNPYVKEEINRHRETVFGG